MSEMVDRVTEAICRAEREWMASDREISLQQATAIAAIREMRGPTWEMVKASKVTPPLAGAIFSAMIDEALK